MRYGRNGGGNWCGFAVCFGVGILMLMFCSLRLLLAVAAVTLIVLGLITMLRC